MRVFGTSDLLGISHVLGKRRGREPDALASWIGEKCKIEFDKSSGRPRSICDQSPFDESVRKKAVETSVAILRAIADMRLARNRTPGVVLPCH